MIPGILALNNPQVIKTIRFILIVLVLVVILSFSYKKIKKFIDKQKQKQIIDEVGSQIIPSELTYSEVEYKLMSQRLFIAMNGNGTDDDAIFDVLTNIKTTSDGLKLIQEFGVKETTVFWSDFTGNLADWLQDELSSNDFQKAQQYFNNVNINI